MRLQCILVPINLFAVCTYINIFMNYLHPFFSIGAIFYPPIVLWKWVPRWGGGWVPYIIVSVLASLALSLFNTLHKNMAQKFCFVPYWVKSPSCLFKCNNHSGEKVEKNCQKYLIWLMQYLACIFGWLGHVWMAQYNILPISTRQWGICQNCPEELFRVLARKPLGTF